MEIIGIFGGTGFVGTHLTEALLNSGAKIIIFSRQKRPDKGNVSSAVWRPDETYIDRDALAIVTTIINLAGASIAGKRWTSAYKEELYNSRVQASEFLINELTQFAPDCHTYIMSSAIGFYGPDNGKVFTENAPAYNDFLAKVCNDWEGTCTKIPAHIRRVIFRFGVVLGANGGAYLELAKPVRMGIIPIIGNGNQIMSWVHITDLVAMIQYAVYSPGLSGIYNAVAPQPVSNERLMKAIAAAKKRIRININIPAFLMKIIMGESSIEVLKSCTASAQKLLNSGFKFHFATIDAAINDIAFSPK